MKIFKSNIILIASFVFLLGIFAFHTYQFLYDEKVAAETHQQVVENCKNPINEDWEQACNMYFANPEIKKDFYTQFSDLIVSRFTSVSLLLPLFIIIPAIFYASRYFKNKGLVNELTRKEYKKSIIDIFKKTYRAIWILPLIIIIAVIFTSIYANNFDSTYYKNMGEGWSSFLISNPLIFITLYLTNIILYCVIYVNISLCITRKYHNFFVAVILSYLCILSIQIFLEIVINGIIFLTIFNSEFGMMFNLINMLYYNDTYGVLSLLIISIGLTFISFLVVYLMYKNKEKLIIDCEKNELNGEII